MSQSVEVETADGPWEWFKKKSNSTSLQKYIVPWLIALHGFGFAKKMKDTIQIREMIVALCTEHKFLQSTSTMTPEQAARTYPIALPDVAKKAKEASSKHIILEFQCLACVHCVSIGVKCTLFNIKYHWLASDRCPAARALFAHRNHVREALIALFETPVSVTNVVGRKVLTRVLCNSSINFDKPIHK